MKSLKNIIPLFVIILSSGSSYAQTRQAEKQPPASSQVQKGYYSIGNNAEKLGSDQQSITPSTGATPPRKGFFSMKPNARKLSTRSVKLQTGGVPTITKGYYSIGNNVEKLK